MKYLKLFEEHSTFDPNKLYDLLDSLQSRGILDKVTQEMSKRDDYVNYFKFIKYSDNKWTIEIYKDSFKNLDLRVNLNKLLPKFLEKTYNNILSVVDIGNIMKQINEEKGENTL